MPDPNDNHEDNKEQWPPSQTPKPYTEMEFDHHMMSWLNGKLDYDRSALASNTQHVAGQSLRDKLDASHARHVENLVGTADMYAKLALLRSGVLTDEVYNINEQIQALLKLFGVSPPQATDTPPK